MATVTMTMEEYLQLLNGLSSDMSMDPEPVQEQPKPKKTRKQFLIDLNKQIDKNKEEFLKTHEKREKEIHTELSCENVWVDVDGKYRFEHPLTSSQLKRVIEWVSRLEEDV